MTTTASREMIDSTTTTSVTRTERRMPSAFKAVMKSTIETAATRAGTTPRMVCRYAPKASPITPGPTVLAVTNIQPAPKPHQGPSIRPPNSYVPPVRGRTAASWAEERALQKATNAAITSENRIDGPAIPAAGAITAKIPAPRMAARPVATASNSPSWGFRFRMADSSVCRFITLRRSHAFSSAISARREVVDGETLRRDEQLLRTT